MEPEAAVPDAKIAVTEDSPCFALYNDATLAYERLCMRLGAKGEDTDVEIIIHSLNEISKIIGFEMFRYGAFFAASHSNK